MRTVDIELARGDEARVLKVDEIHDEDTLRVAARLLEKENRRLLDMVMKQREEIASLKGESPESIQQKLSLLEQQLAKATARLYGPSSERRADNAANKASSDGETSKPTGHGPRPQTSLQLTDEKHELPESDRDCGVCGKTMSEMSGQTEDSEEIDVVERRFVIRKHRRVKYRCSCNQSIKTAPGPLKLMPGSRYSIGVAVETAVQKYAYHMPLARIARQMGHDGLQIDSQTLWDQIEALGRVLFRVPDRIKSYVLSQPVIGVDETRWPLMSDKGRIEGEAKSWYAWAIAAPNAVHYTIAAGRSTDVADSVLTGYSAVVMADGYDVYEALNKRRRGGYSLVHCWVHVRRKFVDVEKFFPEQCATVIGLIAQLYAIEKKAETGPPEERLERLRVLRDTESREVVRKISTWAMETTALPRSGLGVALAYMGDCWKGLVRFLDDPRIPLDNNATERALRGPVVGRKNHYGSRSKRGTEIAALYYTLVESAKLNGLDPRKYIRYAAASASAEQEADPRTKADTQTLTEPRTFGIRDSDGDSYADAQCCNATAAGWTLRDEQSDGPGDWSCTRSGVMRGPLLPPGVAAAERPRRRDARHAARMAPALVGRVAVPRERRPPVPVEVAIRPLDALPLVARTGARTAERVAVARVERHPVGARATEDVEPVVAREHARRPGDRRDDLERVLVVVGTARVGATAADLGRGARGGDRCDADEKFHTRHAAPAPFEGRVYARGGENRNGDR